MSATCRSCGAPIKWAHSVPSGRLHPFDDEMQPGGKYQLAGGSSVGFEATYIRDLEMGYVSHFATCPDATSHRRREL